MDLASTSLAAASAVTQNYATLGSALAVTGQNPSGNTVSAQDQASTQTQISISVLKQSLAIQATTGAQLAQMISQGSGIDIKA